MGRVYEKPPLIEAVCEFRFDPSQAWDWTIPGLIYADVGEEFPKKRERTHHHIAVGGEAEETGLSLQGQVGRWMQFVRADELALIQVGPNLLTVNQLRPYPDWQIYKAMIERSLRSYRTVARPKGFVRIGLRYINRLEIPETGVDIEDYVQAVPQVPPSLPQLYAFWAQRVEIPYEEQNGILALQSGSVREKEQRGSIFMLDLDFRTLHPDRVELDSAMDWVEQAHGVVEDGFEACITEKTRSHFQETSHDRRPA